MSNIEILSALCAGIVNYTGGTGRSTAIDGRLSKSEIAGLLARLNRVQMLFVLAKYNGDMSSLRQLIAHVQVYAAGLANDQGWKIIKGRPVVVNMARMAVIEIISPNRCVKCKGSAIVGVKPCHCCNGTGFKRLTGRQLADYIQVDNQGWIARWRDRYEQIVKYVQNIESIVNITFRSNDKEFLN